MNRGSRLRIMLGVSIICIIGVLADSIVLPIVSILLILLSALRFPQSEPTNYTAIFGPPDDDVDETVTPFNTELPDDEDEIGPLEQEIEEQDDQ